MLIELIGKEERKKIHLPSSNVDISVACKNLKDWLNTISSYDTVKTDRAHVMIAAAMLEKKCIIAHLIIIKYPL